MYVSEANILEPVQPVVFDLYRDVHKGIRAELFAVTTSAGRVDPADRGGRADLSAHVASVFSLLVSHAKHEDTAGQPVIEAYLPELGDRIEREHEVLERRIAAINELGAEMVDGPDATARGNVHRIYLELASFTSAYLAHQDMEERLVMPALEAAIGVEAVLEIHGAIVGALTPEEKAQSLPLMLAAMNIDDRTDFLGGMKATAPPEAFAAVWGLAGSVLSACERAAIGARIGVA